MRFLRKLQFVARLAAILICSSLRADEKTVNLLAMGDWGAGGSAQKAVAKTMGDYVADSKREFSGLLTLGDNFYAVLTGIDDPRWQSMFEKMYDPEKINFPFYISLGNHDYSNKLVEMELEYTKKNPSSRWKFPSKWYRLEFPKEKPFVSVLMLDSNKAHLTPEEWNAELKWIESELAKPRNGWIIACAHHPFFSNGDHGDNGVLQREWGPLFKKYKLDAYVCGHDHDVQHLELPDWSMSFVLAGGGGAGVRPMRNNVRGPFSKSIGGFLDMQFDEKLATFKIISRDGEMLHEFSRTRDGEVKVLRSAPSDPATPRTPKSITRGSEETTKPAKAK